MDIPLQGWYCNKLLRERLGEEQGSGGANVNKDIMKAMGFEKAVENVEMKKCPFCNKQIDISSFRDLESVREYKIGGLCQECQDEFYGTEEEENG
jgi:hypothetical protein